jgi:quercetin dioxygenase-like cupin family protein
MTCSFPLSTIALVFFLSSVQLEAQETMVQSSQPDHILLVPGQLSWGKGPASLPKGLQSVVIEGDPTKDGAFTLRFKLPPHYRISPHWHPAVEHVTVISGTFYMGAGERFDESKATKLPVGGFAVMAIGTRHFGFTRSEGCVIQIHGVGPWKVIYVNPKDDPRNSHTAGQPLLP